MRRSSRPSPRRDAQRGAFALELALSLFVLFPLLCGIVNYGYHFYIAINVQEAERAGLIAAARTSGVGACTATASATAKTNASTAVTSYFALNSLSSIVTVSGTTSTPTCATTPVSPTWTMNLVVDYTPLLGKVMAWDKASPVSGKLRYTAGTLAMRGN